MKSLKYFAALPYWLFPLTLWQKAAHDRFMADIQANEQP